MFPYWVRSPVPLLEENHKQVGVAHPQPLAQIAQCPGTLWKRLSLSPAARPKGHPPDRVQLSGSKQVGMSSCGKQKAGRGSVAGLRRQNVTKDSVAISSPEEDFSPLRDRQWPEEGVTQSSF